MPVAVVYGAGATEEKLGLLGDIAGKHLLEIGCGGAQCGIAFAKQGAIVTGVDIAGAQIEYARELAMRNGVSIGLMQRDMTDLAPIASESQDIVFTASALQYVDDILACFQEVRRVLKPGGVFVFAVGHPFDIVNGDLQPERSYFDTGRFVTGAEVSDEIGFAFCVNRRTVSDYVNAVAGAGLVIERMVEPDIRPVDPNDPANWRWGSSPRRLENYPCTLILKSRKA